MARRIPHARLACFQADMRLGSQVASEPVSNISDTWGAHRDVGVVQEGQESLVGAQFCLDRAQDRRNSQCVQGRHQGIPLFAAFRLLDPVRDLLIVGPNVGGGGLSEKQADERQRSVCPRQPAQFAQHGVAVDVVVSPNPVN